MEKIKAERNIKLYYWFRLLDEPLFWAPILITFIQRVSGMSLPQIYFMESICIILMIVLEIPSGALADIIGRKKTIFLGSLFLLADIACFSLANSPQMIWSANLIWVVGFSLISGAETSLLYDSLKLLGRESEYKRIEGKAVSYRLFLIAICSIAAGYLAQIDIRLPVFLSVFFKIFFCWVCYLFTDPPMSNEGRYQIKDHLNLMKISILFVANHKKVKWVIGFSVLIGVVSKMWFFTYNPYFELVDLPLTYYGWIFFLLNAVAAVGSYCSDWLTRKLGDFGSLVLIILVIALPLMIMGTFVCQAMSLMVLWQNIARGHMHPFMGHFLHQYLDSANRATVTSIKSAVNSFGQFIGLLLFSWVLTVISLPQALQALGLFSLVAGVWLLRRYGQIFTRTIN